MPLERSVEVECRRNERDVRECLGGVLGVNYALHIFLLTCQIGSEGSGCGQALGRAEREKVKWWK